MSSQVISFLWQEKVGIIPENEGNSNFSVLWRLDDCTNAASRTGKIQNRAVLSFNCRAIVQVIKTAKIRAHLSGILPSMKGKQSAHQYRQPHDRLESSSYFRAFTSEVCLWMASKMDSCSSSLTPNVASASRVPQSGQISILLSSWLSAGLPLYGCPHLGQMPVKCVLFPRYEKRLLRILFAATSSTVAQRVFLPGSLYRF